MNRSKKIASVDSFKLKAKYPEEWEEQVWYFEWLAKAFPLIWEVTYHIPNQTTRTIGEGVKLKRMGKKSGVPDIHNPVPIYPYHSHYIELKRRIDSAPSKTQLEMMNKLEQLGHKVDVAYGWEQAMQYTLDYLHNLRPAGFV